MGGKYRIGMALVFGAVLVGAAFAAHSARMEATENGIAAIPVGTVTQTPQEIADSDGDGVPDWEEEFRGTDPLVPNDFEALEAELRASGDSYTPPQTLTDEFGQTFLEEYLRASGGAPLTSENQSTFVNSAISSLEREVRPQLYTQINLNVGTDSSSAAIRSYGNALGELIVENTTSSGDVLLVLQEALQKNEFGTLEQFSVTENAYRNIVNGMQRIEVPPTVLTEHLQLLNVYGALLTDIEAILSFETDPLLGLLKVKEYQSDMGTLTAVLEKMRGALEAARVTYTRDEYGIFFFILRP